MRGDALGVKGVDQLLVDQDVRTARLVLQPLDLGDQAPVVREKRRARLELALHQCRADENLVRRLRIDRPVGHAPVAVDGQPVQRSALERDHLAAARVPLRLGVLAPDEMAADVLQPARLDGRHGAGKEARGFNQLSGGDPAAGFFHP